MPLDVSTIHAGLIIRAAHLTQFYSLLTGALQDQPVSLTHQLTVGGGSVIGPGIVPFTVRSQTAQTANVIEVRDPLLNLVFGVTSNGSISLAGTLNAGTVNVSGNLTVNGYVTAPLNVGGPNERITNPSLSTANLVMESTDGYVMVESLSGSHLTGNAYWDGANWNLFSPATAGSVWVAAPGGGVAFYTLAAGPNPRTAVVKLSIDGNGNMNTPSGWTLTAPNVVLAAGSLNVTGGSIIAHGHISAVAGYLHTTDGTNGVVYADNGSLYLRSAGGGSSVVMDTGTGGLLVSSGGITAYSTIQAAGGGVYAPNGWVGAGTLISGAVGDITANRGGTGYVWLGNSSHYVGYDGSYYEFPTSPMNVPGGVSLFGGVSTGSISASGNISVAGNVNSDSLQCNHNLNVDTITFDSAANSGNAKLAFNQVAGPKISLYDGGGGNFYGWGINSSELCCCASPDATWTFRHGGLAGTIMFEVGNDGHIYSNAPCNAATFNSFGGFGALGAANTVYAFQATNTGSSQGIANAWPTYSSEKIKSDITTMRDGVETIKQLRPVHYTHTASGIKSLGLIAEEVAEVYPQLVTFEDEEAIALDYAKLAAPILSALLEVIGRLEKLEARA